MKPLVHRLILAATLSPMLSYSNAPLAPTIEKSTWTPGPEFDQCTYVVLADGVTIREFQVGLKNETVNHYKLDRVHSQPRLTVLHPAKEQAILTQSESADIVSFLEIVCEVMSPLVPGELETVFATGLYMSSS